VELLDELAIAIYLENKKISKLSRRLQIVRAYEEAEDILISRAIYLDNLKDENLSCSIGYKNHKYQEGICVRCGYVFDKLAAQNLRMRKVQARIKRAKIAER